MDAENTTAWQCLAHSRYTEHGAHPHQSHTPAQPRLTTVHLKWLNAALAEAHVWFLELRSGGSELPVTLASGGCYASGPSSNPHSGAHTPKQASFMLI